MSFVSQDVVVQEPDAEVVWRLPSLVDPGSVRFLGGGTFGRVVAVRTTTGAEFAIKKFTNPFQDSTFALRTYREICILRHLSQHGCPHILNYVGTYSPQMHDEKLQELYLVTEKCDSDLRTVLQCNQLTVPHIQLITYRILCGLHFMHSAGIIHRDLKPENVAIFSGPQLFGHVGVCFFVCLSVGGCLYLRATNGLTSSFSARPLFYDFVSVLVNVLF